MQLQWLPHLDQTLSRTIYYYSQHHYKGHKQDHHIKEMLSASMDMVTSFHTVSIELVTQVYSHVLVYKYACYCLGYSAA